VAHHGLLKNAAYDLAFFGEFPLVQNRVRSYNYPWGSRWTNTGPNPIVL
jgi:hypothetical protein